MGPGFRRWQADRTWDRLLAHVQTKSDTGPGGLTTKQPLTCDGKGRPLAVVLTPGQRHESTQQGPVLEASVVPRPPSAAAGS